MKNILFYFHKLIRDFYEENPTSERSSDENTYDAIGKSMWYPVISFKNEHIVHFPALQVLWLNKNMKQITINHITLL